MGGNYFGPATVRVANETLVDTAGPILTHFGGVKAQREVEMNFYEGGDGHVMFGGSDAVLDWEGELEASDEYVVGILDHRSGQIRIRDVPVYAMSRHVRKLRDLHLKKSIASTVPSFSEARSLLGNTFGTKKAQAQDRERQRGRIEPATMLASKAYLESTISQRTQLLPDAEYIKKAADSMGRPLPPHDMEAQHPREAYPLTSLVPEAVFDALEQDVQYLQEQDTNQWYLPVKTDFMYKHLQHLLKKKPDERALERAKMSLLSLYMRSFERLAGKGKAVDEYTQQKMGAPDAVFAYLRDTFTEPLDSSARLTPRMTHKLQHWMAVCMLWSFPNFSVQVALLARDMETPVAGLQEIYKSVGCTIVPVSKAERESAGYSLQQAKELKKAVLNTPLTFPADKRGKRK